MIYAHRAGTEKIKRVGGLMLTKKDGEMNCAKCKKTFHESDLELSHDVPRYLGGTDKDGRHYLCINCHDKYEKIILITCFAQLFDEDIMFCANRKGNIAYMSKLRKFKSDKKIEIVNKIKESFFNDNDS